MGRAHCCPPGGAIWGEASLPFGALHVGTARGRRGLLRSTSRGASEWATAYFRVRPRGIRRLRPGPGGRRSVGSRRSARPPVWRNRAPGGWRAPKPWGTSRGRPRPASPMTRAPWARGFGVDRIGVRWPRKTPAGPGDLHPSRFFFFFPAVVKGREPRELYFSKWSRRPSPPL